MASHKIYLAALLAGTPLLLAACGGMHGTSTMGMPSLASQPGSAPQDRQACQNDGGIKVTPCRVTFDSMHPGPAKVAVTTGDNNRQPVKESDNCASANVAMVTRIANHRYTVTAGTAMGSCTARFAAGMRHDDGGRNGGSDLRIVNRL